jgi:hypothetical protein
VWGASAVAAGVLVVLPSPSTAAPPPPFPLSKVHMAAAALERHEVLIGVRRR